jgi:hypothetical protein
MVAYTVDWNVSDSNLRELPWVAFAGFMRWVVGHGTQSDTHEHGARRFFVRFVEQAARLTSEDAIRDAICKALVGWSLA